MEINEDMTIEELQEHFSSWEGWSCDKCGCVIEDTRKELINHLKKCEGEEDE